MTIYNGDCLEVLRGLPENSVDSVCTDPPYGLSKEPNIAEVLTKWLAGEPYDHGHGGFMGKRWDSFVPHPDVWREVYRVLKPGGYALVFAGTRTQDLMTIALRMAGFDVRDVIEWLYFSGFPKSMDVGKAFDKQQRGRFTIEKIQHFRESRNMSRMELGEKAGFKDAEKTVWDWEVGGHVPSDKNWRLVKTALGVTDEEETQFEREKVGESENGITGGTKEHAGQSGAYGFNGSFDITAPATPLARKWDGWGTALKPAHEPIIVVRKPLIGTVADNVEKHGTGGINIDGCRIPYRSEDDLQTVKAKTAFTENAKSIGFGTSDTLYGTGSTPLQQARQSVDEAGRFPANAITTDDDAFCSPYFNVSPAGVSKKAGKKDRNADWTGAEIALEPKEARTYGAFAGVPDNPQQTTNVNTSRANNHPTVKPTDLMAWLVRLVTPPGGTVLDPFAGSGTTLVAAKREGFEFIGIEREAEYVEIIEARTKEPASV